MAAINTQNGSRLNYTNTGSAIASGAVVVIVSGASGFIGIALDAIAATTGTGVLLIGSEEEGNVVLTKHTGEAFTVGQLIYWDATNSRLTGTSTGNTRAGPAAAAFASAATSANLLLNRY